MTPDATSSSMNPSPLSLKGRRALVTGGNTGIGAAIAQSLATNGANVAVNYVTNAQAAEAVVQGCRDLGSDSFSIAADVSQADAVERMFQMVRSRYGGLDVLINNAGIDGPPNLVWDAKRSDWLRVLEVNLCGAFYCMQQALVDMIARRSGVIINITSVHETMPWKCFSAYAAAKAGLSMLSKTAALEAAPHNVRILAVAPGVVQTTINENLWEKPKLRDQLLEKIPLHRMAQPEEIGALVAWLASDAARYQTGSTVFVDGGLTLYS